MKTNYPIQWVAATPEYVLACIQEESRQCALLDEVPPDDVERQLPTFATTIHEWREAMDLVGWRPLGQALNQQWNTRFPDSEWRSVLVPERERALRGVCELLAGQARRPVVPPARLLGHECGSAGVFLAIRSLLTQAGVTPDLRPSTSLEPLLQNYPEVFVEQVSRLAPGGLPLAFGRKSLGRLMALTFIAGCLLLVASTVVKEPTVIIAGVILITAGWLGGWCFRGELTLSNANTLRGLTELIVAQQRRAGVDPTKP